jgi:hypothetical protein
MSQIIEHTNSGSGHIEVNYLNNVGYTYDDVKLFSETVCVEVQLKSLKTLIEMELYRPSSLKVFIQTHAEATGTEIYHLGYTLRDITKTSIMFHKMMFDAMYVKTLRDLPLMINHGDPDIIPIVNWRLQVRK